MSKKSSVGYTKKEICVLSLIVFTIASAITFIIFTLLEYPIAKALPIAVIFGLSGVLPIAARFNTTKPYTMKRRIIVGICGGLLIGALLLFLIPGIIGGIGTGVTLEQYNSIETGMRYEKVKEIFKSDGKIMSEADLGDPETAAYTATWEGKGRLGANCVLMFQGGELVSKSQFGLE